MPFRLTRNLQTFFTAFGVEGIFITTLAVAAQVRMKVLPQLLSSGIQSEGLSNEACAFHQGLDPTLTCLFRHEEHADTVWQSV